MNVRENDPWGEKSLGKYLSIKETRKMLNKKKL
jgi:hypothetical protein